MDWNEQPLNPECCELCGKAAVYAMNCCERNCPMGMNNTLAADQGIDPSQDISGSDDLDDESEYFDSGLNG